MHHAPAPVRDLSLEYWTPYSGPCFEDEVTWLSAMTPDSISTPTGTETVVEGRTLYYAHFVYFSSGYLAVAETIVGLLFCCGLGIVYCLFDSLFYLIWGSQHLQQQETAFF